MKPYEEYEKTAKDERAFSNHTMWDVWNFNVCHGAGNPARRCVNDDGEPENGCPLILLALVGKTPAEWGELGPFGGYRCSEKTTPVQARAAEEAALRQRIDDSHYPMFDVPEVS